jgi:uncharacterized membrane protein
LALSEISRLAHESEVRRSVLHNRVRRAGGRARAAMPSTLADYLKMAAASALGFWILTALLAYLSPVEPLHALTALGLMFSAQATLYKIKLASDPSYEIRGCGCGKGRADETAAVLRSRESAALGVPNSVLAILLYAGLIASLAGGYHDSTVALAGLAVAASAYFGYVMVFRLGSLCATCVNIAALNILILLQLA